MIFPDGPIGFRVSTIGWEESYPIVIAEVAVGGKIEEYKFKRYAGEWAWQDNILSEEEQSFLREIWSKEINKRGLPDEQRKPDGH